MRIRLMTVALTLLAACVVPSAAQETPAPPGQKPTPGATSPSARTPPPIPVKVTVVLTRYQGDKKIGSMPYVLGVTASGWGQGPKTTLRMGTDVPVTQTVFSTSDGKQSPQVSYTYRSVGTDIDCQATYDQANPDGFVLTLTVQDSSIGLDSGQKKAAATAIAADVPSFRNFNSAFTALLRDGQTTQYTSATDPVTGEVTKIDVTLNVMK
jgi:hypothetical protein